jgi:hypothetical protein
LQAVHYSSKLKAVVSEGCGWLHVKRFVPGHGDPGRHDDSVLRLLVMDWLVGITRQSCTVS